MKPMKMSPAQIRALEAVRNGNAYCRYREDGNVFEAPSIHSKTLRKLSEIGLIEDGKRYSSFVQQRLTENGLEVLLKSKSRTA